MKKNVNKTEFLLQLKVMIIACLVIFALASLTSCTVYKTPKMQITSVLAVTAEGDTLKLPIDVIRPIYNYNHVTYPRTNYYPYNHMYYNYNNYKPIHKPIGGNTNYNNNNNNSTPITPTVKPTGNVNPPNPVIVNPRKNN